MSYINDSEFLLEVRKGNVAGHSLINKFGFNDAVDSTLAPVADGAVYQTPTSATALEVVSSSTDDAAAGTGARTVIIEGLDANFNLQEETVSMNGTTAVDLANTYTRVFRMYVGDSGTYATQSAGSHAGTITLRVDGAGATWATIGLSAGGFPVGQTEIGCYTIAAGYTGYLISLDTQIESGKTPNVLWFRRTNADVVSAPYDPIRLFYRTNISGGVNSVNYLGEVEKFEEKTDLGAMAYIGASTASVSVRFQLLLVEN